MILNKHGWGLRQMLILSGILILFLFIAFYYIYKLYTNLEIGDTATYTKLEEELETNTRTYLDTYYQNALTEKEITITNNILKTHNLDVDLKDASGNTCSAYVKASYVNKETKVKAYLKCPDYTTEGY